MIDLLCYCLTLSNIPCGFCENHTRERNCSSKLEYARAASSEINIWLKISCQADFCQVTYSLLVRLFLCILGTLESFFFYCELINGLFVEIWCRQVVFCIFPPKKGILMREKDLSQGKPRESRLDCRIRLMEVFEDTLSMIAEEKALSEAVELSVAQTKFYSEPCEPVKKPEASKLMKISFTKNRIFQAARLMSLRKSCAGNFAAASLTVSE